MGNNLDTPCTIIYALDFVICHTYQELAVVALSAGRHPIDQSPVSRASYQTSKFHADPSL